MTIDIITDNSLIIPEYIIDIRNKSKKTIELIEHREQLQSLEKQKEVIKKSVSKTKKKFNKKKIKNKRFFKKIK